MDEVRIFLELIAKYGIPIAISMAAIWLSIDLYLIMKEKWVPSFLGSFEKIALNTEGINQSMHQISEQTKMLNIINEKLDKALEVIPCSTR